MVHVNRRSTILIVLLFLWLPVAGAAGQEAAGDEFAATPPISTFIERLAIGDEWDAAEYVTDVAFGDVDGDGRDEVAFVSNAIVGPRVILLDDAAAGFAPLMTFGDSWGAGSYATSVAFGDVDDDGRDEIGLTRATSVNERAMVLDDAAAGFTTLHTWGEAWAAAVHGVAIAFGDTDGDGAAEVVVAHNGNSGPRAFAAGSAVVDFAPLWDAGGDWGVSAVATAVAFGDADGDGLDEVGITRRHDSNARVFLFAGDDGEQLWATGNSWGAGGWATDIAFGNVDDDAAEEMGITRHTPVNERAFVFDDAAADFATLARIGGTWNTGAKGTSIAFGDVDGDGRDEVALARETTINPRFYVFDDGLAAGPFAVIWAGGARWPGEDYATTVAFGQVDDRPEMELGVGRRSGIGPRGWVYSRGWSAWLPFITSMPGVIPAR